MKKTLILVSLLIVVGCSTEDKPEEIVAAHYDAAGFKLPLQVGSVQIWFAHSGAKAQFLKQQKAWTPEQWAMFDLITWKEYSKQEGANENPAD